MSRPCKCRRVCCMPGVTYFKPAGIPLKSLEENCLSIEEVEAIRLRDMERLEQAECARGMNISRPTFQRVLASARKKIADSLLSGKALRIEGGNYEIADSCLHDCSGGHKLESPPSPEAESAAIKLRGQHITVQASQEKRKGNDMKIAIITEDEVTISQHFGRAPWYMVFTVEDRKITGKEKRAKIGHQHFAGQEESHASHGEKHGYDAVSQNRHASMAEAISDCQVLIAGGMGMGAYDSIKSYHIEPVITDVKNIEEAVRLYMQGELPNLMERLH